MNRCEPLPLRIAPAGVSTFIAAAMMIASHAQADWGNFINYAVLTLPPKYLADIPLDQRTELLRELSYNQRDRRLDYANGYLDYFTQSPRASECHQHVLPQGSSTRPSHRYSLGLPGLHSHAEAV